ncbi:MULTISPECIES: hypothetical protein [Klebsiella]|uniref:hypothetical protein n=1 Tax=Klebsiella TaxID=570 RepID=UPI001158C100|nr:MULTISPECIES: hypothetical protein [Klebsiella]MBZ7661740.1 hypothetical protein [Klebsiella grimontii]
MIKSGTVAVIIAGLLLTGCAVKKTPSLVTSYTDAVAPPTNPEGEVDMVQCEKELSALASVNQSQYIDLKARFEQVMNGASGYTNVRSSINPETRNAIDALYKFQAVKLCSEIRGEMLNSLAIKPTGARADES